MATKYICDGCDRQFDKPDDIVAIKLPFTTQTATALWKPVDLCDRCIDSLRAHITTRVMEAR